MKKFLFFLTCLLFLTGTSLVANKLLTLSQTGKMPVL